MTLRSIAFAILLLIASNSQATAHASLLDAAPQPGAVVAGDSLLVELRFDSRLDARFSRLELLRPNGDAAPLTLQAADSQSLLKASAADLDAGPYVLRWRVLSIDGHANQGEIKFQVRQ